MNAEPISDADLDALEKRLTTPPPGLRWDHVYREDAINLVARIRALEAEREALRAEVARKDEALRQIAGPRNWEEQDRARSIARTALGPWRPTHIHYNGQFVREIKRNEKWVVYEAQDVGEGARLPRQRDGQRDEVQARRMGA